MLTEGAIKSGPLPQARHACHWLCKAPLYRFLNAVYRTSLSFCPSTVHPVNCHPHSLPDICHPLMQLRNGGIYAIPNLARGIGASTRTSRMCSLTVAWAHTHHLAMPQQDGDEGHDGGEGGTSGKRGAEDDATPNQWQRSGRCTPVVFAVRRSIAGRAAASCGRGMAGWGSGPAG